MDFTSSKASWMWAVNSGSPLRDNSRSTGLDQHSAKGTFTFDLTKARGGSSLNPFIEAAASASPKTSASSSVADATTTAGAVTSSGESDGDNSDGNEDTAQRATTAHGAIMGLTFVIVFPLGAVIIRLCSIKALVWVHAMVQIFGYILALAGLGLGIFIAIVPSFQVCPFHASVLDLDETMLTVYLPAPFVPSHHWHHRDCATCFSTNSRSAPPPPVSEYSQKQLVVCCARVAWPSGYHVGYHKWRAGLTPRRQYNEWRDSIWSDRGLGMVKLGRRYDVELFEIQS